MNLIDGTVARVLMKPLALFGLAAFILLFFPFLLFFYIYLSTYWDAFAASQCDVSSIC